MEGQKNCTEFNEIVTPPYSSVHLGIILYVRKTNIITKVYLGWVQSLMSPLSCLDVDCDELKLRGSCFSVQ